jgi:hypothetical protein
VLSVRVVASNLRKLFIVAGLMNVLSWIAEIAVVLRHLPLLGLYDRLGSPLAMTLGLFVSPCINSDRASGNG